MKTTIMILSLILNTHLSAPKGNQYLCRWHNSDDVKESDYQYYEKGKLFYTVSNDADFVYVDMKIEDAAAQNRILKQGLTIWISMDSKVSKKMGVKFPLGSQVSQRRGPGNMPEAQLNADGNLITPISQANTIELIGFTTEQRRFPSDNPDSFRGSVKYDNEGILHYKMLMPIEKLPIRNSKEGEGAMPFAFGIEYGSLQSMDGPRGQGGPPPTGDMASGGSGGGGGGGRSGGGKASMSPGRPASTSRPDSFQPPMPEMIFWIKSIKLATDK